MYQGMYYDGTDFVQQKALSHPRNSLFLGPVHVHMPPLYIFVGPEIKAVVRHEIDNIVVAPPPSPIPPSPFTIE